MTARGWALVGVVTLVILSVFGYARFASAPGASRTPAAGGTAPPLSRLPDPPAPPYLLVRSLLPDDSYGQLGLAPADTPDGPRFVAPLTCERVHFAAGRGVCLTIGASGMTTTYTAEVFDERFRVIGRVPLTGLPSRTRVSPDGRLAAVTVFEAGHSYAESGYSTRTSLIDTASATEVTDLERFAVTRDGRPFRGVDFNFWGVTFAADSRRFYATLASGGTKYLIAGEVDSRTARVVGTDVECPSLSPDGRRVAYKRAFTDARGPGWRLHVRELAGGADRELSLETRSVDDQVEWLDEARVLYHLPSSRGADVWVLDADGQAPPRILVPLAYSPAMVR